jgi:serine/threonine protein phosphatase PrpC
VAGVRHRLAGQPGQDSFAWAAARDTLAVAVADGLGGVPDSDATASRAAVAATEGALAARGSLPDRLAAAVHAANEAARGGGATTLVVALVERSGAAQVARVGDSTAIVLADGGASWRELFPPPASDAFTTVTAALPAIGVSSESAACTLDHDSVLVLTTDGVADPWRDGPTTVAPTLAAALARPRTPLDVARLIDFSRQGCHDDRALLAVWRRNAPATGNAGDALETDSSPTR